jgi:D-lactate dehydrogenase
VNVAVFSTRPYDRTHLDAANASAAHAFTWIDQRLSPSTAPLARGHDAICTFVNDPLDAALLQTLAAGGTRLVTLRCAGYNQVDLPAAASLGLTVTNVPAYSPHAVAEHAIALLLTLNRNTHLAHERVRRGDFRLDGLQGFDLHGKTAGLVGTGRIGTITGKILQGFGCRVLAFDPCASPESRAAGFEFTGRDDLLARADIVSLHCPLLPTTKHLINAATLALMKPAALLINTSRGGLIDTAAAIDALEAKRLRGLGLDVYEHEAALFFDDHSDTGITDPLFARLIAHPNVVVTGHQAFLTCEALDNIAASVLASLDAFAAGQPCPHSLHKTNG